MKSARAIPAIAILLNSLSVLIGCSQDSTNPLGYAENAGSSMQRLAKPAGAAANINKAYLRVLVLNNSLPVSDVGVKFARSISGREAEYDWNCTTSQNGEALLVISPEESNRPWWTSVNGYYFAVAVDFAESGNPVLGEWGSIPINGGRKTTITLNISGNATVEEEEFTQDDLAHVTFADPNLESAVRGTIKKPTGAIAAYEVMYIQRLVAHNKGISSLTGIEKLINMAELWMASNNITDVTPLKSLKALECVILSNNPVSDITPFRELPRLTKLHLDNSRITDFSPLKGMTSLTLLSMHAAHFSDLSVLEGMKELNTLYLNSNGISDLTPIKGLTLLKYLQLNRNDVADISPLKGLTSLRLVNLVANKVSDLAPLLENPEWGLSLPTIYLSDNLLSSEATSVQIPTLRARGVTVNY